jgi:hypothetical protein
VLMRVFVVLKDIWALEERHFADLAEIARKQ